MSVTIRRYVTELICADRLSVEDAAARAQKKFPHNAVNRSYVMRITREIAKEEEKPA